MHQQSRLEIALDILDELKGLPNGCSEEYNFAINAGEGKFDAIRQATAWSLGGVCVLAGFFAAAMIFPKSFSK